MPDSVPNYLTIDSAGRVGANFSGHVQAQGLDLLAQSASPDGSTPNVIRWWTPDYNGEEAAEITGTKDWITVGSSQGVTTTNRFAELAASTGNHSTSVLAESGNTPTVTRAAVRTRGSGTEFYYILIDERDFSDYVRASTTGKIVVSTAQVVKGATVGANSTVDLVYSFPPDTLGNTWAVLGHLTSDRFTWGVIATTNNHGTGNDSITARMANTFTGTLSSNLIISILRLA